MSSFWFKGHVGRDYEREHRVQAWIALGVVVIGVCALIAMLYLLHHGNR